MLIRKGLLEKYFTEMDPHWGSCLEENIAIVRWYLDPQKIAAKDFGEFVRHVTSTDRRGRQVRRLRAIHQAAGQSVGVPSDTAAFYEEQILVERLKNVRQEIASTMQLIESTCKTISGYKLLLKIPGFGPYISALVLVTLANPH